MNGKKAKRLRREAKISSNIDTSYLGAKVPASSKAIRRGIEAMKHGLIEDPKSIGQPSTIIKLDPECTRSKYKELKGGL